VIAQEIVEDVEAALELFGLIAGSGRGNAGGEPMQEVAARRGSR
jgi:hypothetical protein